MANGGFSALDVMLFGGEPLLRPQRCIDLLTTLSDLGAVSAHVVTNGVMLTPDVAVALERAGVGLVQITFDGGRLTHDRIRVTRTGAPTFDTILRNVSRAAKATSLSWRFRIHVTHETAPEVTAIIDELADAVEPSRALIRFALVNDFGLGFRNDLGYGPSLAAQYVSWHAHAVDRGFRIQRPIEADLCAYCAETRGRAGAVINADGTLYSCWEAIGKPDKEVGTVEDGYFPDRRVEDRWEACGAGAAPHGDEAEESCFSDRVDAAILDLLYERRRL